MGLFRLIRGGMVRDFSETRILGDMERGFRRYRDRRVVCEDDRYMVYDDRLIVLVDTG
jgi:hypothetical protein